MTTSDKVKLELIRKGMTQADLAKLLKVTPMTISLRLKTNAWKPMEIYHLKYDLGFNL
jgi:transcriptional regulator with XRE-family HTH domain